MCIVSYNLFVSQRIKKEIILQIKELRKKGFSLPEISRELKVSRTSVLRHIKGTEILPEYLSEWAGKRGGSRRIRLRKEAQALEDARKKVGKLSEREKLLVLSALYWAEGSKKDFSFANTDPNLISVFTEFMRDVFKIPNNRFYINIRLYEDLDKDKSLSFWSHIVKIPELNIKGFNILVGKKKGKLEYGMCRLRIAKGGDILKQIKGVNKAVFESLSL